MNLLITGAKGQVGSELVLQANETGNQVFAYGSKELDISSLEQVQAEVRRVQADVIINAAAYTAVDRAEMDSDKAYAVNSLGSYNLALVCKEHDIPLLHISTDYIYDGEKASPYIETDRPNPTGVYGASKLEGDKRIEETWSKHLILRVSWVFGAHGNNFVKTMLRLAEERDELSIVDDQYGAPTSAKSIAETLLALIDMEQFNQSEFAWGVYNLQSDPGATWFGFAQEIFKQAQELTLIDKAMMLNPIPSSQFPTPVKRPENSKLDGEKLSKVFALHAANWKDDLKEVLLKLKTIPPQVV